MAAPDGRCVVCRRATPPVTAVAVVEAAESRGASRLLTTLLGLCAVASLGGLAWALSDAGERSGGLVAISRAVAREQASPPRGPARTPPRALDSSPPRKTAPGEPGELAAESPEPQLTTREPTENIEDTQASEQTEQDRRRHAMIEADIDTRALAAARRNVSVEMYSTSWCGSCAAARSYMRQQNIAFVDHDVDQDAAAQARAHALSPRHSVPVLDIEGDVLVGFSPRMLEASLDRAARKRTGL